MPIQHRETIRPHVETDTPISIWENLQWLALADRNTLLAYGLTIPTADRLRTRINRVAAILAVGLIVGMRALGAGQWDGQIALAVGAVYLSNAFNRHQFKLGNTVPTLVLALFPLTIGLLTTLNVMPAMFGSVSATVTVLIHVIAMLSSSRFNPRHTPSGNDLSR
jgi:hypothetical protein